MGVTNSIKRRIFEHREALIPGFTKKYSIHMLVYYEEFNSMRSAIEREKRIKKWKRQWKISLIEKANPQWRDLYPDLL